MGVKICDVCGYENPANATECEICANILGAKNISATPAEQVLPSYINEVSTDNQAPEMPAIENVEYFVMCPESSTKTVVQRGDIKSYYCPACHEEHIIDNLVWTVESRTLNTPGAPAATVSVAPQMKKNNLWLEEVNTHHRIDICKPGGTLGRYGTFGSEYFQSGGMNTVSGEHCLIKYELENWVLFHVSRTNQTKYNGMILSSNEPTLLENGKMLTLANTITFIVRID